MMQSEDTLVYIWGRSRAGLNEEAIKSGAQTTTITVPITIDSLNHANITQISCGGTHNLCVNQQGDVFSWGFNWDGQLGHGSKGHEFQPRCIKKFSLYRVLQNRRVASVAAGGDFCIALCDDGTVYGWGSNQYGQLGCESTDAEILSPTEILGLHKQSICIIAAGGYHALAVSSRGKMFSWGRGAEGRLGHGGSTDLFHPRMIDNIDAHVINVACGWSHNLCIDANGEVYSWGNNSDGQLGLSNYEHKHIPTKIGYGLSNERAIALSGGYFHSAVLTLNRDLYTFGWGKHGQLGHGMMKDELAPKKVEALSKEAVKSISCGGFHSLAVTENGEIFSWGLGEHGQLGLGSMTTYSTPQKIPGITKTQCVSCGWWQSMCIVATTYEKPVITKQGKYENSEIELKLQNELAKLRRSLISSKSFGKDSNSVDSLRSKSVVLLHSANTSGIRRTNSSCDSFSNLHFKELFNSTTSENKSVKKHCSMTWEGFQSKKEYDLGENHRGKRSLSLDDITKFNGGLRTVQLAAEAAEHFTIYWDYPDLSSSEEFTITYKHLPRIFESKENPICISVLHAPSSQESANISASKRHSFEETKSDFPQLVQNTLTKGGGLLQRLFSGHFFENIKEEMQQKETQQMEIYWDTKLLPLWNRNPRNRKLRAQAAQFAKLGLPLKVRGRVWANAIGNRLNLSPAHYWDIVHSPSFGEKSSARSLIEVDIPRTFPKLRLFNKNGPWHSALTDVLLAWDLYRPDIGYVQGMSFVAAHLMLYMEPATTWICLSNLLSNPFYQSLYKMDLQQIFSFWKLYDLLFSMHMPDLYSHFNKIEIGPEHYLVDWFYTIFAKTLDMETVGKIWDQYLFADEIYLFVVALAILKLHKKKLIDCTFETGVLTLRVLPLIDQNLLLDAIASIEVPVYLSGFLKRIHGPSKRETLSSASAESPTSSVT